MSLASSGRQGVKAEINVTPLVDVTLVLLIIFIVVTPMLQQQREVQLPTSSSHERAAVGDAPLTLVLSADRSVWIGDHSYAAPELPERVQRELALRLHRDVVLKADESLSVGDVRRVMGLARQAGASSVALAVKPTATGTGR